ncbi:MAG: hypothetical protein E6H09_15275 [Bacteroidetes bacterium]|nr:MAG: hypothetical protein E6H09_15275 [Bacteroidota bacterium]
MQFIKNLHPSRGTSIFLLLLLSFFFTNAFSQSTYLPQGDKANIVLERMEIKLQKDSILNFSKTRPFSRQDVVGAIEQYYKLFPLPDTSLNRGNQNIVEDIIVDSRFSRIDYYNMQRVMINNLEWVKADLPSYHSKKPIWKAFYKTPANLYEVHVKDFDLVLNPVFQYVVSKETNNDQHLFLNSRGVTVRGRIANKIGFAAYITDNQERDAGYVQDWTDNRRAVPGAGLYKAFKDPGGVDYFDGRGYFTFGVTKYINVAFGYDKNFIGNGYRSMFLSDFTTSNLFLKLNTRIWKLNYQNLFMELHSAHIPGGDKLIGKKYAAMHHLDIAVTKWMNIGVFEGIIFGRKDHFEFSYLNPIIFYRSIELQNGSFDNSVAGIDLKANVARRFQFYGQLLLDEFKLSEIKAGNGWWGNKYAIQAGVKYIDAFTIRNLDLQLEFNSVRPFTYSHNDSVANYTHYNQPLAHPLMANFNEFIAIARYQPAPKWFLQFKAMAYKQGLDSVNSLQSYGSNIFLPNIPPYRVGDYGYYIGSGVQTNVVYTSLLVSYELRENLFLELFGIHRRQETKTSPISSVSSTVVSFGVRWNMHRREFEF